MRWKVALFTCLVMTIGFFRIFADAIPVENSLEFEAGFSRICRMSPDREIVNFLKARGISEEMLTRSPQTLDVHEAEIIVDVCCKAGNELCCLLKNRMSEKLRDGYDLITLEVGPITWYLDIYGQLYIKTV